MRIAIVINTSWNIYNFRGGLIDALREDGHELVLIAPPDDYSDKIKTWGRYIPLDMDNTGSNPVNDLRLFFRLRNVYKKEKLGVILHYTIKPNIYGTLAARSLGIPSINNVSGLGTIFINENFTSKIGRWLYKIALNGNCHVLFQNADDQRDFNNRVKHSASNSLVPGSGIDLEKLNFQELPRNEIRRFLMVARLLIDKGVKEYMEAARLVNHHDKRAEFVLAGELDEDHVRGITKAEVEEYTSKGWVNYLGHVDMIEVEMIKADWIVLPSYREGTPRTLLEAAALGRPLIATDVPGCREVVENGVNGFLCDVRSGESLKNSIELAIEFDYNRIVEMGRASRRLAKAKFDQEIVIEKYKSLIGQVVDG